MEIISIILVLIAGYLIIVKVLPWVWKKIILPILRVFGKIIAFIIGICIIILIFIFFILLNNYGFFVPDGAALIIGIILGIIAAVRFVKKISDE